jgi:hypothetical protein
LKSVVKLGIGHVVVAGVIVTCYTRRPEDAMRRGPHWSELRIAQVT